MQLKSGPAKTDALWQLGTFVLFLAVSGWFFYDWKVGWPQKNREEAIKALPGRMQQPDLNASDFYDQLGDEPTKEQFEQLLASDPDSVNDVDAVLGAPQVTRRDGDAEFRYYASKTGLAMVEVRNGRLQPLSQSQNWSKFYKPKSEVEMQLYWGLVPLLLSFFFLYKFFKARALQVTLDDQALVYDRRRIAYNQITELGPYNPKGLLTVYYTDEAGRAQQLRLDNQKVDKFDEIVGALAQAKGVPNPIMVYRDGAAEEGPTA